MNSKDTKKRLSKSLDLSYKKRYRYPNHVYAEGSWLFGDYNGKDKGLGWNGASSEALKNSFSIDNVGTTIGTISSGLHSIVDSGVKNSQIADTTAIENDINNLYDTQFSEYNTDTLMDQYNSINWAKDSYEAQDVRGLSGIQQAKNTVSAIGSGIATGAQLAGPWGALAGGIAGLGSGLAGIFIGNKKAKDKAEALNNNAQAANRMADLTFLNSVDSLQRYNAENALKSAYAKNGGMINIKKKNKGKFTESANRAGMGVQEFARHVLSNKDDYSSTLVKRANFARNASKWKHSLGGYMFDDGGNLYSAIPAYQTHGGDFLNGVNIVRAGGTHEDNPYEGVPMGIAPDGQPNLVEEGEVIYNDYVFSNRLHLNEKELKKGRLPKKYKNYTFALAAEDASKESAERPNDPISKRGLEDILSKLASIQEEQRMKKGKRGTQQMMAFGGKKYDGLHTNLEVKPSDFEDPYEGSLDQALEEAELNYEANKIPEVREELERRRRERATPVLNTSLRYAPALGSALGTFNSIFEKPDYKNADLILNTVNNLSRNKVYPRTLTNKMVYNPLDRNYYLNQLKSQAGITRRAITNSGNNAGNVMTGLLAADYNAQNAIGNTLMQMEQYNNAQKQRVAEFNRGTDQYNSQVLMNADLQNAQLAKAKDEMALRGMSQVASMKEAADTALALSKTGSYSNFFDNLGVIGRENRDTNMLNSMKDSDMFGILTEAMRKGWRKDGGMLTKRNKRRRK